MPLRDIATYLDFAIEYSGYLYVLSRSGNTYRLDLYTPEGAWLARTQGVNADKLAVDYWRDVYTLNYQALKLPNGNFPNRTKPSVSHWTPLLRELWQKWCLKGRLARLSGRHERNASSAAVSPPPPSAAVSDPWLWASHKRTGVYSRGNSTSRQPWG